jgi:hypothetical protein
MYGYYIKFYLCFQLYTLTFFKTAHPFSSGHKLMHTKTLPTSSAHSARETHKKYMEAISEMKNTASPPTCIYFKGSVLGKHNITNLPEDHPFKTVKYIFEYMKKRTPYVQIVLREEGTHSKNSK